ncbi:MAG: endonuclease/exonuclease/phosphatase family protein, partial [Ardenticatenaceae bacterium]
MPRLWWLTTILGAWLLLWRRFGDRWGWLGMLNAWAEWGTMALGVLAVVGALRRQWGQALGALALWTVGAAERSATGDHKGSSLPILLALVGNGNESRKTEAAAEGQAFTLFSANLYKFNPTAAPHVAMIRRHEPDVICLQELQPPLLNELLEAVGNGYPYRALRAKMGAYGFGTLSRYPLEETGYWDRPGVRAWAQRVRLTLPGGAAVEVYNVHLVPPASASTLERGLTWGFRTREAQLRVLEREIESRELPALIIG